ncbi:MAG: dihydroorotate dehydrogenase electron transfer subunit [Bacteroidales bacterium]|nr:dihydroorotate dehydrogenase electron transfer subunit [Bacteroidales bacterium]
MEKRQLVISENVQVARDPLGRPTFRIVLSVPQGSSDSVGQEFIEKSERSQTAPAARSLRMRAGQFVDIAIPGFFLRRPISVCDCSDDRLVLYYKVVGEGTQVLSTLPAGTQLDVLTGLGNGFRPETCREAALLAGGGLGAAPLYLLARELLALGREVTVVLGFNSAGEVVLEEAFRALGVRTLIATMDGSAGVKGFVTDAIAQAAPAYDYFYTCGPMPMMKALCAALPVPGQASLEERMGCGAGFCYGCSIRTRSGVARVCKDGPVFDKEDILW